MFECKSYLYSSFIKLISIIAIAVMVVSCGEESADTNNNKKPEQPSGPLETQIYTEDIFLNLSQGSDAFVAISDRVSSSDNTPVFLNQVEMVDRYNIHCNDVNFTDSEMQFSTYAAGVCVYKYTVSADALPEGENATAYRQPVTAKANVYIVVQPRTASSVSSPVLPILSLVSDGDDLVVKVKEQLGVDFPEGAKLDNTVTLLGSGRASVDTDNSTITYSGGSNGVTRIIYSLTKSDSSKLLGVLDISVSALAGINRAPVFTNFEYKGDINIDISKSEVMATIDIGSHINDPDNQPTETQPLQIVDLKTFNATVAPASASLSNTKFTFKVKVSGVYYVSVTASDHHGGYATGIVKIKVSNLFSPITVNKVVFLPPLSFTQAEYAGFSYTDSYTETVSTGPAGLEMALVTYDIADAICKSKGGALPTKAQMDTFVSQEQTRNLWSSTKKQWPVGKAYFTQSSTANDDNVSMVTFNTDGSSAAISAEQSKQNALGYISCVDLTPVDLSIDNENFYIGVTSQLTASYSTSGGLEYPYNKPLSWSVLSGAAYITLAENKVTGESSGNVRLKVTSYYNSDLKAEKIIPVGTVDIVLGNISNASVDENRAYTSPTPIATGGIGTITWSVIGDDASKVSIDGLTGVVKMVARDYKAPVDSNGDNDYEITLRATDSQGNFETKSMTIKVKFVFKMIIVKLDDDKVTINENTWFVLGDDNIALPTVINGTPPYKWFVGGPDAHQIYSYNPKNGSFSMWPKDYENPVDTYKDNTYKFTLMVTDSTGFSSMPKLLTITVMNVND